MILLKYHCILCLYIINKYLVYNLSYDTKHNQNNNNSFMTFFQYLKKK